MTGPNTPTAAPSPTHTNFEPAAGYQTERPGPAADRRPARTHQIPSQAELWAVVKARPRLAPAALALLAVDRYAEAARAQAAWLTGVYPGVAPERLALVAVQAAASRSRRASALIVTPFGAVTSGAGHAMARARLVIEIAAIFGHDPADPGRAADILTALRVHPDRDTAAGAVESVLSGDDATVGSAVTTLPATGLARRVAGRYLPGSVLVSSALIGPQTTADIGHRAIRLYQRRSSVGSGTRLPDGAETATR